MCTKNKLPKGLKKGQVQQVIFEGGGDDLVKTTHITCACPKFDLLTTPPPLFPKSMTFFRTAVVNCIYRLNSGVQKFVTR